MPSLTKPPKSILSSNWLWPVGVSLIAAVVGIIVLSTGEPRVPTSRARAALDPGCDLRAGPCTSVLGNGRSVRFSIEPRSIPPLSPLQLTVETDGFPVQEVSVDLNGLGMNMGLNRVVLSAQGDNQYAGVASLSVCIRDAMEWEAIVTLADGHGLSEIPFRFITVKPAANP